MKRVIISIAVALVLVISLGVPALAAEVDTSANVIGGGGSTPVIKCKWETSDLGPGSDDDATKTGTQIDLDAPQQPEDVYYWVVVTDEDGMDNITEVWVDVYELQGGIEEAFKYEIFLDQIYCDEPQWPNAADAVQVAYDHGLLLLAPGFTLVDVKTELLKGEAKLYKGHSEIVHGQAGGYYRVEAYAQDAQANVSVPLHNCFEYVRTVYLELDFTAVNFGDVFISTPKKVSGDEDMTTPDKPSAKNGGNCDLDISVHFDDMGFTSPTGKVQFDARLGLNPTVDEIDPSVTTLLPGYLPICNTYEMDFSIHVIKDLVGGAHSGKVTITAVDRGTPDPGVSCPPLP